MLQDEVGNESRTYRLVNKYLESPLEMNRTLVLNGGSGYGLGWGDGEEVVLWATGFDRLDDFESNYTLSPVVSSASSSVFTRMKTWLKPVYPLPVIR